MNTEVRTVSYAHKKARWQAGSKGEHQVTAISLSTAVLKSNPALNIPLLKARGISEIHVTPEIAQHWLTFNTSNRQIVQTKVDQFRDDMEAGNWKDDGATIRFAPGKLLDGQHRLHAVVLSGEKVRMIVVHGLSNECQVTMDTGRPRSARDVLSIEGLDSWESATLGAALHTVIAYESGMALHSNAKSTNREIRDYYLEHSSRLNSTLVRVKGCPRKHPILAHSQVAALHYLFGNKHPENADMFFDRLMTGEGLSRTSAIYHLRQRLQSDILDKKPRPTFERLAFVVKAWNGFLRGAQWKTDNTMRLKSGEEFPEIA